MANVERIDPRLFPLTREPVVRLYAKLESEYLYDEQCHVRLQKCLSSFFTLPGEQFFLAESGSGALIVFLQALARQRRRRLVVALPAFSCGELAAAIMVANCEPILLEMDEHLDIAPGSIDFACRHHTDVLIWPSLFGPGRRNGETMRRCRAAGIDVVLDEAQSFPLIDRELCDSPAVLGTLLSFGRSKRMGGPGGGAMVINDAQIASEMGKGLLHNPGPQNSGSQSRKVFSRLDELVAARGVPNVGYRPIGRASAEHALDHLKHLADRERLLEHRYQAVSHAMVARFGREVMAYRPLSPHVPSIAAFPVRASERFGLIASLGTKYIQSTWYYWPLHLYHAFKERPCEPVSRTEEVAASIVILPCQYHHSIDAIEYLVNGVRQ